MVSVVLQMSGFDPTYPTQNNMFQLMVINQVLLLFYLEHRKVQSLLQLCLEHISMTWIKLQNFVMFIILLMTLICFISTNLLPS